MDTILISTQAPPRRTRLREILGPHYEIVEHNLAGKKDRPIPAADVWILDEATFETTGARVGPEADGGDETTPPVLLLVPRSRLSDLDASWWEQIDDVVAVPLCARELQRRVQTLSRLSRATASKVDRRAEVSSKYEALFNADTMGILTLRAGEIIEANTRAGELLGCSPEGLLGRSFASLAPPKQPCGQSSVDKSRTIIGAARREGERRAEWRFDPPGCAPFWANLALHPVANGDRQDVQVLFWDVTDRKELVQELEKKRERLATAQRIARLGSWERDFESEELYWSDETYRIFGWDPGEAVTHARFMEAVHPEDRAALREQQQQLFREGTLIDIEYRIVRPDGELRILHERGEAQFAADGTLLRADGTVLDVTERKKREETLRQQRNLLEQTQRIAGAWEVDRRTGEASWSEEVYRILELPTDEDVDLDAGLSFYLPGARRELREALRQCIQAEEPFDLELPIDTATGTRRWVRTVGAPSEKADGAVVKIAGAFQDITDRKQAQDALAERESRLRGLANSIPGVVFQFYALPDGTYGNHFISEHAETVLGIPPDPEYFFERCLEQIPEGHRERFRTSIDEAVAAGEPWRTEVPFEKPSGERIWILGTSTPQQRGEQLVFNGVLLDITDRKKSRQKLERYSEYTERLLNASDDLFFVTDVEGHLQRWNERVAAVTGFSDSELRGADVRSFVPEDQRDQASAKIVEVFDTGGAQMEMPLRRKDGTTIPYEFKANCVQHPDGDDRLIGIGRDVTERKQYEETLLRAKQEAEEAARLKTAMLANMSHEIRTPLTSILGFTEVLDEKLDGEMETIATTVHRSAQRLLKTLDSVLKLSKLEAGVYELERTPISLTQAVRETVEMFEPEARKADLTLETDLPSSALEGYWNEGALNRIVENLLENAIKFTPAGGQVTVRVRSQGTQAVLEVEDTGVGIRDDVRSEIFDAFKQESEGLDREYEGSGLGLSIVEKLTDALGGDISVESEKGVGTCFTVVLTNRHASEG
mgnify:CR=1 FL=1